MLLKSHDQTLDCIAAIRTIIASTVRRVIAKIGTASELSAHTYGSSYPTAASISIVRITAGRAIMRA